jgi:hypothetical protein
VADGVLESAAEDRAEHGDPKGVAELAEGVDRAAKGSSATVPSSVVKSDVAQQRQVQHGIAPSPLDGDEHDQGGAARASSSMVRPDPYESLISA